MRLMLFFVALPVFNVAAAQTGDWKIDLKTNSGWGSVGGVEVDATGLLVTTERDRRQMPRCARVPIDELGHAGRLIEQIGDYIEEESDERTSALSKVTRRWLYRADDLEEATFIIYYPDGMTFEAVLPLSPSIFMNSDRWVRDKPPQPVVELLERVWNWRAEAEAECVPGRAVGQ